MVKPWNLPTFCFRAFFPPNHCWKKGQQKNSIFSCQFCVLFYCSESGFPELRNSDPRPQTTPMSLQPDLLGSEVEDCSHGAVHLATWNLPFAGLLNDLFLWLVNLNPLQRTPFRNKGLIRPYSRKPMLL